MHKVLSVLYVQHYYNKNKFKSSKEGHNLIEIDIWNKSQLDLGHLLLLYNKVTNIIEYNKYNKELNIIE